VEFIPDREGAEGLDEVAITWYGIFDQAVVPSAPRCWSADRLGRREQCAWPRTRRSASPPGRPASRHRLFELTSYIDGWLQVHRTRLQLMARGEGQVGGHLWLDRYGRPKRGAAIRTQIEIRTKQAFGRHVWPHLFRDCAVTELVDCAPEEIGIAPDLLGHADLATTKKHYIQAVGMKAHARVQEVIAARRRAATSRDSTGTRA
jgi:integrase